MNYRELGSSGIQASTVALGAWAIGGGTVWGGETDDAEATRAIHAAIDAGVNLIDTAPAYGFGHSEELVGRAIRDRRDKVLLATKCGLWWEDNRGSEFCEFDGKALRRSLRPDTIREELEASLRRLETDRIDLYQTHWPAIPPEKTPIAETMACLMELKREGKIRAIGVSNVRAEELTENAAGGELDALQLRYSMLFRNSEADLLPWCASHRVATLAYMPLEQGLLSGRVRMDTVFPTSDWRNNYEWNPWFRPENRQKVLDLLAGWEPLASKYDCTMSQLVIAWTLAQPGVTHVLCGARRVPHARENAGAAGVVMEHEDAARIRCDVEALGSP